MTSPNGSNVQQDGIQLDNDKVIRRLLDQLVAALAADPEKVAERVGDHLLEGVKWREAADVLALDLEKARAEVSALRADAQQARPGPQVIDVPDPT